MAEDLHRADGEPDVAFATDAVADEGDALLAASDHAVIVTEDLRGNFGAKGFNGGGDGRRFAVITHFQTLQFKQGGHELLHGRRNMQSACQPGRSREYPGFPWHFRTTAARRSVSSPARDGVLCSPCTKRAGVSAGCARAFQPENLLAVPTRSGFASAYKLMEDLKQLNEAIINGDAKTAKALTEKAISAGTNPVTIVHDHMVPAMNEVGKRFDCNEYFVPELLLSARAMKSALELLRPLLAKSGTEPVGRVVIGTVKGDLHDIGKNLVASMLEGGGFEVFDLGVNVTPEKFIAAVKEKNANIVAMSALLTTTMPAMKSTIEALQEAGLRSQVKVIIGGAPITQKYADEIGADGYSENAPGAVSLAKTTTGK